MILQEKKNRFESRATYFQLAVIYHKLLFCIVISRYLARSLLLLNSELDFDYTVIDYNK